MVSGLPCPLVDLVVSSRILKQARVEDLSVGKARARKVSRVSEASSPVIMDVVMRPAAAPGGFGVVDLTVGATTANRYSKGRWSAVVD